MVSVFTGVSTDFFQGVSLALETGKSNLKGKRNTSDLPSRNLGDRQHRVNGCYWCLQDFPLAPVIPENMGEQDSTPTPP